MVDDECVWCGGVIGEDQETPTNVTATVGNTQIDARMVETLLGNSDVDIYLDLPSRP